MELGDDANLSDLFLARVADTPAAPAYRQFKDGAWREWTWAELAREVGRWQAALLKEGLKRGDRVALCLPNSVEWVLFDQAALGLELVVVPVYHDDRPENIAWCLDHSGSRFLLIQDAQQWKKISRHVHSIDRVVHVAGDSADDDKAVALSGWLELAPSAVARSTAATRDLATIVYTSGTSGRPNAVMLSHRNILSTVRASLVGVPAGPSDRFLSFLPLSHAFERTCGYYAAMFAGALTVYARSIAQLGEDLLEQPPHRGNGCSASIRAHLECVSREDAVGNSQAVAIR